MSDEEYEVIYSKTSYEGWLNKWFHSRIKSQKLLHAPVLVSTIDHLVPCTEGVRGGKQIVPMLRLLTSDLILDEPDEFDLNDLPSLSRLINWAGMLGTKVLLSTATMPPALAYTLFDAYQEGRKSFNRATGQVEKSKVITCAWFDEFSAYSSEAHDLQSFRKEHDNFVKKRIINLEKKPSVLRKAKLLDIDNIKNKKPIDLMSQTIHQNIHKLHTEHHQVHANGKKVSIGLVRLANINPLVAIARQLVVIQANKNFRFHYCVYHSQYPLAQRSLIEHNLDRVLYRKEKEEIWQMPEIKKAVENLDEENQVFIVLATSVAEVGRDHDYDWAIVEPSSMRSLIQLSGRVQRHRKNEPITENVYIISKNFRALRGDKIAFYRPGFESENRMLESHDLHKVLDREQYAAPNAKPSIQYPMGILKKPFSNLVAMEHAAYCEKLLGMNEERNHAGLWWKSSATWCSEIQRRQPFRSSSPDEAYCLYTEANMIKPVWKIKNERVYPVEYVEVSTIEAVDFKMGQGNQGWFDMNISSRYKDLAERFDMSLERASRCFGEVRLRANQNGLWSYHPLLGVFQEIEESGEFS
jgi:CRISPR-associated endonuclease/helicase Cas3